ncbi:MAG: hypothetical protein ACR2HF_01180 [Methylococcaceae bacterium]
MSSLGVGEAIGGVAQGAGNAALGAGMAAQGAGQAVSGIAQGAGVALAKLGDVLVSPVNMLCDWAKEPLKGAEHERMEKSKDRDFQREIERETEVVRIISEIEQLKKDKEFERMKDVSDAMMRYQKELTRVNVEAVEAIGCMRIELQKKAYELIYEKTQQYAELQNWAIQQAQDQLSKIDNDSSMAETTKSILRNSVDKKLAGVIDNATRFIEQLNEDMQLISKDINIITSSGQKFIERHLSQFQLIGFSNESVSALGANGNEPEMLPYRQVT